jgi:hypothetical protein
MDDIDDILDKLEEDGICSEEINADISGRRKENNSAFLFQK